MKCPICGKELEIMKKQVGAEDNGSPVFNQYAVCRDCKKQWNLDKQRAKKAKGIKGTEANEIKAAKAPSVQESVTKPIMKKEEVLAKIGAEGEAAKKPEPKKYPAGVPEAGGEAVKKAVPKKRPAGVSEAGGGAVKKAAPKKRLAGMPEAEGGAVKKAVPKKRPSSVQKEEMEEQKYANIPPEKVRMKKEKAVRQAYEDMLSTDPDYKPKKKKSSQGETTVSEKAVKKKVEGIQPSKEKRQEAEKKRPVKASKRYEDDYDDENEYDDDYDEEFDYMDDVASAKYRMLRVILGILSVLAFGYFGYKGFISGLDSVASGGGITGGMTYIVLAVCMLAAGLLLLIMQNSRSIAAYLLPIIIYLGSGVFAFLKKGDEKILLYSAVAGAILALLLIILAATSRNQEDEYEYDDEEDDPFEDDYE